MSVLHNFDIYLRFLDMIFICITSLPNKNINKRQFVYNNIIGNLKHLGLGTFNLGKGRDEEET